MRGLPPRVSWLALGTAATGLLLGAIALALGMAEGAISLWGFGAACLLQVPPAMSVWQRLRDGLGNSGLERERLTLRTVSHFLRLLALGMALAAILALWEDRALQVGLSAQGLAALALGLQAFLWWKKRGLVGIHPTLDLDAARARTLLDLAVLLLVSILLGHWFPWADGVGGLALALRLFLEGRTLGKSTTLPAAACGGCGSGSGCG